MPVTGTTDGSGVASFSVPVTIHKVRLVLDENGAEYHVSVGHMDPVEEKSGVLKRLAHLGFFTFFGNTADEREPGIRFAVARFQKSQNLEETGEVDDDTRAALVNAHGC